MIQKKGTAGEQTATFLKVLAYYIDKEIKQINCWKQTEQIPPPTPPKLATLHF